ncbi:DNA polymerase eta subunit [Strigomonas culicis]|uniref:DNA polymerase eta subunit n=1 Tax=Strigomonas culicis TaxID=28005 RepID=S9VBR2_9TRYP|nr:DNA polymerase eta subunit [Strigomonas culicis]|eukprot:EPY24456.1 DNA polymerase eta subunit [Strigomonas culicis]
MERYATTKCVVHIDMDCFYAQVEAVRLGIACRDVPFILSQWGNLIAVNYPARAKGIARFNTVKEARELCPEVRVGIVPTYRVGESVYAYHAHTQKDTHKVALEPYREASRQIFSILHDFPHTTVEKASVDEAFVDVTEAAQAELAALRAAAGPRADLDPLRDVLDADTKLIDDNTAEMEAYFAEQGRSYEEVYARPMRELKRRGGGSGSGSRSYHVPQGCTEAEAREYRGNCLLLCAASRVVQRMRGRICDALHYDCSAGIAHNRLLAKSISATHKPNQQTVLLPDRGAAALFATRVDKLRGFGGKFGHAVARVTGDAALCREAWLVPLPCFYALDGLDRGEEGEHEATARLADLRKRSRAADEADATSRYAYYRLRGFGDDGVAERVLVKTLMASKNFSPATTEVDGVAKWLVVLCTELAARYAELTRTTDVRGPQREHQDRQRRGCTTSAASPTARWRCRTRQRRTPSTR